MWLVHQWRAVMQQREPERRRRRRRRSLTNTGRERQSACKMVATRRGVRVYSPSKTNPDQSSEVQVCGPGMCEAETLSERVNVQR